MYKKAKVYVTQVNNSHNLFTDVRQYLGVGVILN